AVWPARRADGADHGQPAARSVERRPQGGAVRHPRSRGGDRAIRSRGDHVGGARRPHHRRLEGRAAAPARHRRGQGRARVPRPPPRDLGNAEGRGAQGLRPDRRRLMARDVIALHVRTATLGLRWARWPTRRNLMLLNRTLLIAGGVPLAFAGSGESAKAQGVFTITSPSFKDGERLATKNAGNNKQNPNWVGEIVSPALSGANPPAGTKSYALLMFDPEG